MVVSQLEKMLWKSSDSCLVLATSTFYLYCVNGMDVLMCLSFNLCTSCFLVFSCAVLDITLRCVV